MQFTDVVWTFSKLFRKVHINLADRTNGRVYATALCPSVYRL